MTFLDYLNHMKALMHTEEAAAKAEQRQDEAVFARIRYNVYDVCATVHGALQQAKGDAFPAAYEAKLHELERTWSAAWDKAAHYADADRTFTEDVKLAALRDVIAHWEENHD